MSNLVSNSAPTVDVSVVIVSFNTREVLRECLQTLERQTSKVTYETIVVDNESADGSADMVERDFPAVRLVRSAVNLGFAAANNRGFALAQGRYVSQLNSDAFMQPGALDLAVQHMDAKPTVGLSGGRLVGRDGSWQPSVRKFPSPLNEALTLTGLAAKYRKSRFFGRADRTWADPREPGPADWVPGAFTLIRREVLEQIGHLDERFFLYFDDVDLCRRVKALGYSVWYFPDVVVTHLGGESAKAVSHLALSSSGAQLVLWRMRSQLLYHRKYHGAFGAWLTMMLETSWNRLRALSNARRPKGPAQAGKAQESRNLIAIIKQAWRETHGGQVCPPKPW
jgi:GT2 family glycosyltransferase